MDRFCLRLEAVDEGSIRTEIHTHTLKHGLKLNENIFKMEND